MTQVIVGWNIDVRISFVTGNLTANRIVLTYEKDVISSENTDLKIGIKNLTSFNKSLIVFSFTLTFIANIVLPKLSPCAVNGAAV